ncbi:MAG: hypothetical protein P4L33_06595 [Capsulimonadaceae bacterium]|nr:hypothetical protein [Capsulimonadaceae bacterium]
MAGEEIALTVANEELREASEAPLSQPPRTRDAQRVAGTLKAGGAAG